MFRGEERGMGHTDGEYARRLAELIRGQRQAAGLTQEQLALRAGLSVGAVRDVEQGRTSRPRAASVRRLARGLGLDEAQGRDLCSWLGGLPAQPGHGAAASAAAGGGTADAPVRLEVLGPLAAWRDRSPVPLGPYRQRAVLGLLAVNNGMMLHRESIIDVLWGERPPASAVNMVQAYVSRLRQALHPGRAMGSRRACSLEAAGAGYRFCAAGELDLHRFAQVAREARSAKNDGDPGRACELYEEALALWQGEPLADIELLRGHPAVVGLRQQRAEVIVDYADAACACGAPRRALPLLRDLAAAEPLDELVHARLMITLAGADQQAAALRVYEQLSRRLDRELGVRPGPGLVKAHEQVLRQELPVTAESRADHPRQDTRRIPHLCRQPRSRCTLPTGR
jgi:DNA-binding SARP family transcriptional activator/DNA-binding XRE family transcriptional regulator